MGKLPYPERDGQTHWESCFREPKHHNCAVAEVDRLLTRLAEVEAENGRLRTSSFQQRTRDWMRECFGAEILNDVRERNFRFGEEALELLQAAGCTKEDVLALVEYVYNREVGHLRQEVGGTMVCLAALCTAHKVDMGVDAETELARCWQKIDVIRAKHHDKVLRTPSSPLPGSTRAALAQTKENQT